MVRQAAFWVLAVALCAGAVSASEAKGRHVLVEPARQLTAGDRAELAAAGLTIGKPIPGGRYLATLRAGATFERDPRIRSIEPIRPERKIHPSATREAGRPKALAEFRIVFHADVSFDEAREAVLAAGGSLDALRTGFGYGKRLTARMPGNRLAALANDDRVLTITDAMVRRKSTRNAVSASLSDVSILHGSPYDLTGFGVDLSLMEIMNGTGAQTTHPDFGGRLSVSPLPVPHGPAPDYHATHVAGTIGGSGLGDAAARGMAPGAELHQFEVGETLEDILWVMETGPGQSGASANNNSWGFVLGWDYWNGMWEWQDLEEYLGAYDLNYTAPLDAITIEQNVLFVHSSGNDGDNPPLDSNGMHKHYGSNANWCFSQPGLGCPAPCTGGIYCEAVQQHPTNAPWTTIGDMESAKNILTIGAVDSGPSLASFSSRGPARDGRVKPELVARGVGVYSTVPTSTYSTMSGTSMAAPVVTGIAGLLAEQWQLTFGGADPLATTLKTLMIAGAEDLGNVGPDYQYGFGLVNAKNAVDLIAADGGAGSRIRIGSLDQGQTYEVTLSLASPQNLRVVLGWADPDIPFLGGDDIAAVALVNDLDVVVIGPAGTVTYPWILDKNNPGTAATRGPNHVDNVEMIEIAAAAAGTYRIVVQATNIADAPPQQFVLVANAPVSTATGSAFALTATGSGSPSAALSWTSVGTGTTYDVYYRTAPGAYTLRTAGLSSTAHADSAVSADTAYLYRIAAHLAGGVTVWSNADLATTVTFGSTGAGNVIQYSHINQLATVANEVRELAGLGPISFSSPFAAGGPIRASHVSDLQAGISGARSSLALPAASFPRTVGSGMTILGSDFTSLQDAMK